MDVTKKNILVVGLGKSGAAAAAFLNGRGAEVTVTDMAGEPELAEAAGDLRALGISLQLGGHDMDRFLTADLIVVSPGVPHTIKPILNAVERGVPVMGEIELASRFIKEPMIAVTGTNGKTTVTMLLGKMLRQSGLEVFVGGNIGAPLIGYVDHQTRADLVVVEVSSFQLDTIVTFRPRIGILLNITEDHLDRYPDFQAYARSKARIFENQTAEDSAVVNHGDPAVRSVSQGISAQMLPYGNLPENGEIHGNGACLNGSRILCRLPDGERTVFDLSRSKLAGRHNYENAGAACLAALAAGGTRAGIQTALDRFEAPGHRLELVTEIDGVRYYNDSKATNVDAVARALESFTEPVILIMGGRDKGGDFTLLQTQVGKGVKKLIVMGEAQTTITKVLGGAAPAMTVPSMEAAVAEAAGCATSGDVILLSPGCASFDRYTDYKQRGRAFCSAVEGLK